MTATAVLDSPVGPLRVECAEDAVTRIAFAPGAAPAGAEDHPLLRAAAEQLRAYFAGELERFELPLRPAGTDFQRAVWERLAAIPYGTTTTYGALAEELGGHGVCRAVGRANGANPVVIVLPCHRVIGSDGSLTGFGGGLDAKRWLLRHEGALLL